MNKYDKTIIIYDDYNSRIKNDGIIGTITPNFGSSTLRNGTKIIEIKTKAIQHPVCDYQSTH